MTQPGDDERGAIAWFARNPVAANLLMGLILVLGGMAAFRLKREVFPSTDLNRVSVSVPYPGASPEEVEEGICMRIEEEVQGIAGIKEVQSVAAEGSGTVDVEVLPGESVAKVMEEVKNRVDAITSFPEEAERPVISRPTVTRQVINVAVAGDTDEASLKRLGERVRDELLSLGTITKAELLAARPYEVSVEVSELALRRNGLTFDEVAEAVRRSSLDLPGGTIKTEGGEVLLRTKGQAYVGAEFEALPVVTRPDGTRVLLGDVATVVDGFADQDLVARFDGKPAVLVTVFRVGEQDAFAVADAVHEYIARTQPGLPPGIALTAWRDDSALLRSRQDLLVSNALQGLVLVFVLLALLLRFKLAWWAIAGLPVSVLGALWLMPYFDFSLNMISLFAFILVTGILVDDAIVVSENVYTRLCNGEDPLGAAIRGTKEVAVPVTFAMLTTVAAFAPMFDLGGNFRKVWQTIPFIVIACLLFSWLESKFVLPAHLVHVRAPRPGDRPHVLARGWGLLQWPFQRLLDLGTARVYRPLLRLTLRWRYLAVAAACAVLLFVGGLVAGGRIPFRFLPEVEGDNIVALLRMPQGTPARTTARALARVEAAALALRSEVDARSSAPGAGSVIRHILTTVGDQPYATEQQRNQGGIDAAFGGANLGEVNIQLAPSEERTVSAVELMGRWRELAGEVPDAVELTYSSSLFNAGADVDVRLSHPDMGELEAAATELKERLRSYAGVTDIADSFRAGKRELRLQVRPAAEALGLSLADLAGQVRQGFYGEEAQRIQRGREEIKVMVRYPEAERRSLGDLEAMRIRTPAGDEVPFAAVAEVDASRGYATIRRADRARKVNVTAKVDPAAPVTPGKIVATLTADVLPELRARHPGLGFEFEGQAQEQADTIGSLVRGFAVALFAIFALMAIPLKSYVQPILIMTAIPFGLVGAVLGHILLGMGLSIMSMFGLVALTGVVVNDGIVLVDFVNRARRAGVPLEQAVREVGVARFRPILLTSSTTFIGLLPLISEKSVQAQFLIPMAVSLGFGVLFATAITLLMLPATYLILHDAGRGLAPVGRAWRWLFAGRAPPARGAA
jgi:multidrug efflux pump subunit AcrB